MELDYRKAAGELRALEEEFWRAWGTPLMDGIICEEDYRARLGRFAMDCYKIGLLSAAAMIEQRTREKS